ncbi:hypothetical protein [Acinetobacter guillouiae]|uniref:hypothetical protein n=1 Tax=Acinetobacter guillouiae TaxID=106649 RepID=UPI0028D803CD|nr:hypothetical protein [Acinetobacter guillouiae]
MIDMTCQGCEQRREWIRKQSERAKERMRKVLRGLGVIDPAEQQTNRAEQTSDATKQQGYRTEQSTHSDQQRAGSTD